MRTWFMAAAAAVGLIGLSGIAHGAILDAPIDLNVTYEVIYDDEGDNDFDNNGIADTLTAGIRFVNGNPSTLRGSADISLDFGTTAVTGRGRAVVDYFYNTFNRIDTSGGITGRLSDGRRFEIDLNAYRFRQGMLNFDFFGSGLRIFNEGSSTPSLKAVDLRIIGGSDVPPSFVPAAAIPVPASIGLLGTALAVLGAWRLRRRAR